MKILVLIVGLIIFFLAIKQIINLILSMRAKNWPTAEGKLDKWNIRIEDYSDGELDINEFKYSYEADGTEYISEKIGFGFPIWIDKTFAEKSLDHVLENSPKLKIYYNPKKPTESVLVVGIQIYHLITVFMYLLTVLSICIVYLRI